MVIAKRALPLIRSVVVIFLVLLAMSFVLHTEWARVILAMVIVTGYFITRFGQNDSGNR